MRRTCGNAMTRGKGKVREDIYSPLSLQLMLEQAAEEESRRRYPRIWAYFDHLILEARKKRDGVM